MATAGSYLLLRTPDYGKVVPAPDQGRIIEIEIDTIAKMV
jgi:hypothetical protein